MSTLRQQVNLYQPEAKARQGLFSAQSLVLICAREPRAACRRMVCQYQARHRWPVRAERLSFAIAEAIGDGKWVDYNLKPVAELHRDQEDFNRPFAYLQPVLEMVRRYRYPDGEARAWGGLGELCLHGTRSDGPRR